MKTKDRKKPPKKKKTSTDKRPASTIKKNGFLKIYSMLKVLRTPVALLRKKCPNTTHIIANDLTPFSIFKSED